MYIHKRKNWPEFTWDDRQLIQLLAEVRFNQGKLLGKMEGLGLQQKDEATLKILTDEVVKSSAIEGENLQEDQVRSSIARRLGMAIAGLVSAEQKVEGVVEMMVDATQRYDVPLTQTRLLGWHSVLFPSGMSGLYKINAGAWRTAANDPMQVVSGAWGKERVHFEAPAAFRLNKEMDTFLHWFNNFNKIDSILKSAVAHLWFVTLHPFEDGNGRIARAIAEMQLSRSDKSNQRYYSMSSQIWIERNEYYHQLENTQRGNLDITSWLVWYLQCLNRSMAESEKKLSDVLNRSKFWERNNNLDLNARQRMILIKLLENFEGKLTTSKWAKMAKCSQDTALRDIQDLVEKNILEKEQAGGRSTSYRLVNNY